MTFALIISFSLVYFILHYIKILLKPKEIFPFVKCILRWWSGGVISSSQSVLFLVRLCIYSCSAVWFVISVLGIFPASEVDFQVCDFLSDYFFLFSFFLTFPSPITKLFIRVCGVLEIILNSSLECISSGAVCFGIFFPLKWYVCGT